MEKLKKIIESIKKNDFTKKLVKNFSFAAIGEGGASFINLFIIIVLIKLIGDEGYGILTLSQSYMLIMDTIINLQCWKGVIKFGEESYVKNDCNSLCGYIKLGSILDISTAIIGSIISFLFVGLIGKVFAWSSILINCARIFSLVILFHFSGTPTALLRIENKFNWVSIQKISAALLKIVVLLIVYLIYGKISILTGVILYSITDIFGHLMLTSMSLYLIHKKIGIKNLIKSKLPKKSKEFVKFTIWTTLSDVVDLPVQYFDVFIISKLGLNMVSIFKFFKQVVAILSKLTTPLYQAIFPQFSSLVANDKKIDGFRVVIIIRNVILKVMVPFSIVMGLSSPLWLKLLFNDFYAEYWYVLSLYLLLQSLALSYTTIHPYFVSLGLVYYSFKYVLISNIVYACLAIILVPHLGMIGLVLSYGVQFSLLIYLKNKKIKEVIGV